MRITEMKAPCDQAEGLRRLAGVPARRRISLAVTSGKGGVGKTNIAVNLAVCLAAWGRRVTLVDVDVELADADVLMDIHPPYNLSHVLGGERTIDQITVPGPAGMRFVGGGSGVPALANMDADGRRCLVDAVRSLQEKSEFVIYDCGAGVSANVLDFAETADIILVVSTSEPTSLTDAYAMVKTLVTRRYHGQIQFVVNMARTRSEAQAVYRRAAAVSEKFLYFMLADGGYVLQDTHVGSAVRGRSPVALKYPRCPSSVCMTALAARLVRTCAWTPQPGGLLSRFVGLFV